MRPLLFLAIFYSVNLFSFTYLECDQSENKKKWSNQKDSYKTFYIFSPEGRNLKEKTSQIKNEPGIYRYFPDLGLFGLTSKRIEIDKLPIKIYDLDELSKVWCGPVNDKCKNYIAYIDRKDLKIYKFSARYSPLFERGIFTPDNRGKFEVVGQCNIITEKSFDSKIEEIYSNKTQGNKI